MKKILHKLFGWFDCVECYTAIITKIKVTQQIDRDGGIFLTYWTKCSICGKENSFNCSGCQDTTMEVGMPYIYAHMGMICCYKHTYLDDRFLEFVKKYS